MESRESVGQSPGKQNVSALEKAVLHVKSENPAAPPSAIDATP